MKGYDDSRAEHAADIETDSVFEGFDATESRHHLGEDEERARKIARLREEVRTGVYRADVRDIARLLTSAMDPTL
ncbi:flagellar biosynthesis anti-sigma factor FlgM [Pseudodesulfovibrio sp.]|uniref:flagellar biosynthesis anti-sigma factor FlgM n=1 Tax=Pseudodesulfovibrio sp. TaxID=2035812 RepID=UPI0026060F8A|nr:flagellar biosynthesis anti-sigma factor FlgM [Pseudodesulfovibrio sp.]MDD3313871.1 flagellar biosynthesis anti-sigma factor FlgM [Pseudodesulfovibrio sp.]